MAIDATGTRGGLRALVEKVCVGVAVARLQWLKRV